MSLPSSPRSDSVATCSTIPTTHSCVTTDPEDEAQNLTTIAPGYRFFYGYDNKIARAYGSAPLDGSEASYCCN